MTMAAIETSAATKKATRKPLFIADTVTMGAEMVSSQLDSALPISYHLIIIFLN